MASGCLSLFFADQILDKLPSLEAVEYEQLISPALQDELGKLKNVISAVRAAFLYAEGSSQRNKGLRAVVSRGYFFWVEHYLSWVDFLVNELLCWVRRESERSAVVMPMLRRNLCNTTFTNLFRTNSPMKRFQMKIKEERGELELWVGRVFANISDRIKSGEEISIDSFGGDTEGHSYGKNKDEIIQSLIPPFGRHEEMLKSIGRRLLFQNDDDDPDDVAVNTLTNIFYFKYSEFYCHCIAEQVNIIFPERVINDISTILMQRYALLPLQVKYCFDYCSLFPRDYVIEVALLVKLWMAQGFAADEDVGRRYFKELLATGFFQLLESDMLETTKCRMDSHAFALSAITSGSRYVLMHSDGKNYITRAFHVSFDFHLYSQRQIPTKLLESFRWNPMSIRSFLLPCQLKSKSDQGMIDAEKIRHIISPDADTRWKYAQGIKAESVSDLLISKLTCLRALELHDMGIQRLPDYIDKLKFLKYLDLSRNPDIKLLPNSISRLWHLQTLKLSFCFGLQELPKDMRNLINLRHLEIDGCYNLRYMPPHLGQLTNLQTLSQFVLNDDVRSANDREYCSQIEELGRLNSLRGELKIKNLSSIVAKGDACKDAALDEKQHLQFLTLEWGERRTGQYESQLENLKPPQNLKSLTLKGYGGVSLSSWLHPGNHVKLPSLKMLLLDHMANLEYFSVEFFDESFPSLQELWLTELPKFKGWWNDDVCEKPSFPCLSKLIIQDCPKLVSMPFFPTLEEELMLDSTSLKPFQQTLALKKQASPPLSKLKNLSFVGIEELDDTIAPAIPWKALTSLCSLKFDHLPNLRRLPKGLRHLTNLQELSIWRCKIKVLPKRIDNLKSLEKLAIWVCPKFRSLPQEISRITSLKTLDIEDCPILLQRCQKETGADWDKIAHIPNKPSGLNFQPDDSEDESASSDQTEED